MSVHLVRRAFVDIEHGQIHCRIAGDPTAGTEPPLLMLHGGPGSSAGLMPMIAAFASTGTTVIAPDMMGNGDSDPPPVEPDMAFYAACILQLLDALEVSQVDCYGHHAGAQIACELAIIAPERVRLLILDGVGLFPADQRAEFLSRYAPPVEPVANGEHLARLWTFLSATTMRFPHYSASAEAQIAGGAPLPPEVLTDLLATVTRNWRTYHLSYRASFIENIATRLPLVRHPAVVLRVSGDPLARYANSAAELLPDGRVQVVDRTERQRTILELRKQYRTRL